MEQRELPKRRLTSKDAAEIRASFLRNGYKLQRAEQYLRDCCIIEEDRNGVCDQKLVGD